MRLTIINDDSLVQIDGISYKVDLFNLPQDIHAVQWYGSSGEIEFRNNGNVKPHNQQITSVELFQQFIDLWTEKHNEYKNLLVPTEEQLIERVKLKAEKLLADSDWSVLSDVALQNQTDWLIYRNSLREIRINPTTEVIWPVKPEVVWAG